MMMTPNQLHLHTHTLSCVGPLFYAVGVGGVAAHLAWQISTADLDNFQSCLDRFRSNRVTGGIALLGCMLGGIPAAQLLPV